MRGAGARGDAAHHPVLRRGGAAGDDALPQGAREDRGRGDQAAEAEVDPHQLHGDYIYVLCMYYYFRLEICWHNYV